ncbi:autotransporter domain-containing protein [Achromobacter insuavis]|uniref:autotransporter family protein n=1 Tax=Achromobacter insuavis TaxID=1287735 RepID=UPI0023B16468|nr:autotransporter domain-containing protein [Achromobacter insuavis]
MKNYPIHRLVLPIAILSTTTPWPALAAPGDIASGGGQGGGGANADYGAGGGGGAGGVAGGGGGGGGGQSGVMPTAPVDGGGGGAGATLSSPAGPGANGGNSGSAGGGVGGFLLGDNLTSGGSGGGGAASISGPGGRGGDSLTPSVGGNLNGSASTVLSNSVSGGDGQVGEEKGFNAGGGGGSGGQGGLVLTAPGATLDTAGNAVRGGNGAVGTFAGGGGGGGGAGLVLISGGAVQNNGSDILGGAGGNTNVGLGASGGSGGAGLFLVDGGTLSNNAGTVKGGAGGIANNGKNNRGGNGGAGVLANRGTIINPATISGAAAGAGANGGVGGDGIVANGTAISNLAAGRISGGSGGASYGASTAGGEGGAGVRFINTGGSLVNAGMIQGGNAGASSDFLPASGGAAIVAQGGVQVTNSGTLVGGPGSFSARANAVQFSGGGNRLTLTAGSTIVGNVVTSSGAGPTGDVLALGGDTTDASTTFNVGQLGAVGGGAQYQGFENLEKTGASLWTLTGANTGLTSWTLRDGTLAIASDAALGNPAGSLALDGGTLRNTAPIVATRPVEVLAGGGTLETLQPLTLQGALGGNGALAKTGAATLTLNGASTYAGALAVQAGKLVVGDSTHAAAALPAAIIVGNGATLGGQGMIGSVIVASGGVIAPGNSIGTLHVSGNLTLAPGSVYQVEVDSNSTASDRIAVGGTATLGGSVVHIGPDGNFSATRDYVIVTAAGGVAGSFQSVASNYAFLEPQLSYGANAVTLRMPLKQVPGGPGAGNGENGGNGGNGGNGSSGGGTRPIRFADAANTRNQRAAANAVQSLPRDNPVYARVLNLPAGAPPAAFDALSGEMHASATALLQGIADTVASLPVDHLRVNLYAGQAPGASIAQRDSAAATMDGAALPRSAAQPLWAQVFGNWRSLRDDGNAGRVRNSDGGLFVGGDSALRGGWRLGGALGYTGSHASLRDRASSADIDSYTATLYGGKAFQAGAGQIEWTAGLAYTWHDIDTRRDAGAAGLNQTLKANYHARTAQVFTELGYRLALNDRIALQPFAGVNYSDLRTRSFSESGGSAALDGDSKRNTVTTATLGLRGEARFESAGRPGRVHAMAGWRHAFGDLDPATTVAFSGSAPFTVAGTPLARAAAVIGLGIDMRVTPATTVGVAYNGQYGGGNTQNAGSLNVAWRF